MTDAEKMDRALAMLRKIHREFGRTVATLDADLDTRVRDQFKGDFPAASLSYEMRDAIRIWHARIGNTLREIGVDPDGN